MLRTKFTLEIFLDLIDKKGNYQQGKLGLETSGCMSLAAPGAANITVPHD